MSYSLWPHGLWLTRLLRPWDFPGKNTGVGCYFLLQEIFPTQGLNPGLPALQADSLLSESPDKAEAVMKKNTEVGCHFLLQEIFPTQGSNLHWQADSLTLSHLASPHSSIYICQSLTPNLSHSLPTTHNHNLVFYMCDSISALQISFCVPFLRFHV